jgi:hypothetical protein
MAEREESQKVTRKLNADQRVFNHEEQHQQSKLGKSNDNVKRCSEDDSIHLSTEAAWALMASEA